MLNLRNMAALSAAAGVVLGGWFAGSEAIAARGKNRAPAEITRLETPLGLAGARGSGPSVAMPFSLRHGKKKWHRIRVEWGADLNGDGTIEDFEFRSATQVAQDARDTARTSRGRRVQLPRYRAERGLGAANAFVWDSFADASELARLVGDVERDLFGRVIRDQDRRAMHFHVGDGVIVRMRSVSGRGRRAKFGPWVETEEFSVDNRPSPQAVIQDVEIGEVVQVRFASIASYTEDLNGNGVLDAGEDLDDDGEADFHPLNVLFQYATPPLNSSDPTIWTDCTPVAGDTDARLGLSSSPEGVVSTFAWDIEADLGGRQDVFLLRARPYDPEWNIIGSYRQFDGEVDLTR